jgi:hypothetical protein
MSGSNGANGTSFFAPFASPVLRTRGAWKERQDAAWGRIITRHVPSIAVYAVIRLNMTGTAWALIITKFVDSRRRKEAETYHEYPTPEAALVAARAAWKTLITGILLLNRGKNLDP